MMYAWIPQGGPYGKSPGRLWLGLTSVGASLFVVLTCGQWALCWYQCFCWVFTSRHSMRLHGPPQTDTQRWKGGGVMRRGGGGGWGWGGGVMCLGSCVYACPSVFHSVFPPYTLEKPRGCHTHSPQTNISFDPNTPVTDSILTSTHKVLSSYLYGSHLRETHSDTETQEQTPRHGDCSISRHCESGTHVWVTTLQWGCPSCSRAQYLGHLGKRLFRSSIEFWSKEVNSLFAAQIGVEFECQSQCLCICLVDFAYAANWGQIGAW